MSPSWHIAWQVAHSELLWQVPNPATGDQSQYGHAPVHVRLGLAVGSMDCGFWGRGAQVPGDQVPNAPSSTDGGEHHPSHVDEPSMDGQRGNVSPMDALDGATRVILSKLVDALGDFHALHSRLASTHESHSE